MNHYDTLGVPRDADISAIVQAWRRAASNYHPDKLTLGVMESKEDFDRRHDESAAKFHAAREAFNCLMDRDLRARHDAALNGAADPGLLSEDDFNVMNTTPEAEFPKVRGVCIMCAGTGEVRVAAAGFWTRRKCPGCKA